VITAIDTNILLDILRPNEKYYEVSANALQEAAGSGVLVVCDIVYAELCVHFETQRDCDTFLESTEIRVEPLNRTAHFRAGRAWRKYRQQGGPRTRILSDFLIGAHAELQANRLVSRDRGFYRQLFPGLSLLDPSRGPEPASGKRPR
jgi:predicted nucleic acid-binding protein